MTKIQKDDRGLSESLEELSRQHSMSKETLLRLTKKYKGVGLEKAVHLETKRNPLTRKTKEFLC